MNTVKVLLILISVILISLLIIFILYAANVFPSSSHDCDLSFELENALQKLINIRKYIVLYSYSLKEIDVLTPGQYNIFSKSTPQVINQSDDIFREVDKSLVVEESQSIEVVADIGLYVTSKEAYVGDIDVTLCLERNGEPIK